MMIRNILNAALMTTGLTVLTSHAGFAAGYVETTFAAPHRAGPVALHVYYPDDGASGTDIQLGKNAVFKGAPVTTEAGVAAGDHPILLLSHGSGGNGGNLAWIASYMADQGYLVFAPNHPGTTSGDSTPQNTVKLWERPADFTALLDHIEQGGLAQFQPDLTDITALGFSLGGHTALALGGARVSAADYVSYCEAHVGKWDCAWLAGGGVDLAALAGTRYESNMSDARIDKVIAIDPALAQAYTDDSLAAMDMPVHILNLGAIEQVPAGVHGQSVAARISGATMTDIPGAWHFSFLGECTRMGAIIIAAVEEDPICKEQGDDNRATYHAQIKAVLNGYIETETAANTQ